MSEKLYVIKIGGNVIDNPKKSEKFFSDFSTIKESKILVHGGGKLATELAQRLGVEQQMMDGRRITDAETLKITTMVYAGWINKRIVASLQTRGINALGLSGADGNVINACKRKITEIDYGFVGDIKADGINVELIANLLSLNITPVFCAITHNGEGQLLNTNADTIASALAIALSKKYEVQLNFCFEKKGVLKDLSDDNSVIDILTSSTYRNYLGQGIILKGMVPKLENAFEAITKGVKSVVIAHSDDLINTTKENAHAGTKLIA